MSPDGPAAAALISEQELKTAGQRRVNILWEVTQSAIALAVVVVTLYVNAAVALRAVEMIASQQSGLMQLNVMAALVTGFYFGRTNHTRQGGVGGAQIGESR